MENPKPDTGGRGQLVWDAFRQMMQREGINIGEIWLKFVLEQIKWLSASEARRDFDKLREAGCAPLVLATTVGLIRISPQLQEWWKVPIRHADKRQKMKLALERAATALEDGFGDVIAIEDENQRADFAKVGYLPPSRLVLDIRRYAAILNATQLLRKEFELHSLEEFTKYLLVGYVKRATGKFCDRSVSGLIGEAVGTPDYDEVALRMWRRRNYQRLDKHLSWNPDLLLDLGNDLARRT
jgi:hypothetical protein